MGATNVLWLDSEVRLHTLDGLCLLAPPSDPPDTSRMSLLAHLASCRRSRQRLTGSLKSEPPLNIWGRGAVGDRRQLRHFSCGTSL